jgi:predicted ferric reductase
MTIVDLNQLFASSTTQIVTDRVADSWHWYIIRASGFISAGLVMLLMISGIGHVTGLTYKYIEPIKAWALHKAMALALVFSITVHGLFILFDHYIKFSFLQVFIPFLSKYNNGTSFFGLALGGLAVSFGILAMYGVAIIVLSSLGWIDSKKDKWRLLHYTSYLVVFLVFLHGLYVGTDLRYGVFRKVWEFGGLILIVAIISRLLRAGTLRQRDKTSS